MKRLLWIIIFAALTPLARSQAAPISGMVINQYGSPVAGAQVYICSAAGSSGLPCSPVANIYYDYNLSSPAPNPFTTDANGNFNVYVGALAFPNTYVVNAIANPGGTPYTWLYSGPACQLGGCTFTGNVTAPIFNATSSPYYEINGVQISSSALSDGSNLAKLNAANTFTGSPQTAPIFNATTQFNVGGSQIASANLSDGSNLAKLNASNTFTAATNTFQTVNAVSGYQVNGVALAASNLSNGTSGSGAICLASGSACSSTGTVSSVGISSSTSTALTVSGSPITTSGTITLGLNLTGTGTYVVSATSSPGASTALAAWDGHGNITTTGLPVFSGSRTTSGTATLFTSASGSGHLYEVCMETQGLTPITGTTAGVVLNWTQAGYSMTGTATQGTTTTPNSTAGIAANFCGEIAPDSSTAVTATFTIGSTTSLTYAGHYLEVQ